MNEKVTKERPVVRLSRIEISNFMNVEYGEIVFPDNQPDDGLFNSSIVGLYGQNGSGKSALVRSLNILKTLCGEDRTISPLKGSRLIRQGCQFAEFTYEFVLLYPNRDSFTVTYSFSITSDLSGETTEVDEESLKCKGIINRAKRNSHLIMDSTWDSYSKLKKKLVEENKVDEDGSLIFNQCFVSLVKNKLLETKFEYDGIILQDLSEFLHTRLHIIESSRFVDLGMGEIVLGMDGNITSIEFDNTSFMINPQVSKTKLDEIRVCIDRLSKVFEVVVPGVRIQLGSDSFPTMLFSERDGRAIPFTQESYGIRKIFSIIQHIVNVYNLDSYLLVVDEFDEGIFEFLLGQILGILKKGGHGQLLFSSHNLRPLEVLSKDNIFFTTSNPLNRYIRMIQIKPNNNLRDSYFRAIQLGGQKEELYKDTDEDDIETAFIIAGRHSDGK